MNKKKRVTFDELLLGIVIVYQIFLNSFWRTLHTSSIWKMIGYGTFLLMAVLLVPKIFIRKDQLKNWFLYFIALAFSLFFLCLGNLNVCMLLFTGVYCINLTSSQIIRDYLFATASGIIIVLSLAVVHLLPMHNAFDGTLLLGFRNPNTPGFYLAIVVILFFYYYPKGKAIDKLLLLIITSYLLIFQFNDYTSSTIIVIYFLFRLFFGSRTWIFNFKIIKFLSIMSPLILTYVMYWLGIHYQNYEFIKKLNLIVTSRPMIWNYYLKNFQLTWFGNSNLTSVVNSGMVNVVGGGAFDGAFISFPLTNGLLAFIITLVILSCSMEKLFKFKQFDLVLLLLVFVISGFSENQLFNFYQCPAIAISFSIWFNSENFQENSRIKSIT